MSKIIIVMPAYNAVKTLKATHTSLPKIYEKVLVCDDMSSDKTYELCRSLNIECVRHESNRGYGANQKTLYDMALKDNADIIIMVHPDNQYTTSCLPEMVQKIESGAAMVIGSRMKSALKNGMPWWKYISNKALTFFQNTVFKTHLSEFHSGLRAYDAKVLTSITYKDFSDDFVFDSEMIAAMRKRNFSIEEVATECFYNDTVSSISFKRSLTYGVATLRTLFQYLLS